MPTRCEKCSVRNQNALKTLNEGQLCCISEHKTSIVIKKGEVIFEEGDMLPGVYCISEGFCKLTKLSFGGKNQIVRFVTKGDILGQKSIITKRPVSLTATALADVQACLIPKEDFQNSFAENHFFSSELFKNICDELKQADDAILDLAQKTVKQRLAHTLMFLEEIFGKDHDGYINMQLSREEIGTMIGSATESLIRMLSEFTKNGWIETKAKRIKVLNRKQLDKTSQGM